MDIQKSPTEHCKKDEKKDKDKDKTDMVYYFKSKFHNTSSLLTYEQAESIINEAKYSYNPHLSLPTEKQLRSWLVGPVPRPK